MLAGCSAHATPARGGNEKFVLTHPATQDQTTRQQTDSRTCSVVLNQKGSFTVGRGTGAYKGITGYGTFSADYTGVLPRRNGKCDTRAGAVPVKGSTHAVIVGTGAVLLPPS